jgi:hypothetical protein
MKDGLQERTSDAETSGGRADYSPIGPRLFLLAAGISSGSKVHLPRTTAMGYWQDGL